MGLNSHWLTDGFICGEEQSPIAERGAHNTIVDSVRWCACRAAETHCGVIEHGFQVPRKEVADSNRTSKPRIVDLLERGPRLETAVTIAFTPRPVQEHQVDVVRLKVSERLVDRRFHRPVVGWPHFCCDEQFCARYTTPAHRMGWGRGAYEFGENRNGQAQSHQSTPCHASSSRTCSESPHARTTACATQLGVSR